MRFFIPSILNFYSLPIFTNMKLYWFLTFLTLFSIQIGIAQTTLVSGDVAVIYHLSETTAGGTAGDRIGLVLLRDIASATTFKVTENGQHLGQLDTDEGVITITASTAHSFGKVINITLSSTATTNTITSSTAGFTYSISGSQMPPYALSTAGDQTIVYTGTEASPNLIYTAHFNGTNWLTCNNGSHPNACGGNQCSQPSSGDYFAFGVAGPDEWDNNWYIGPGFANKTAALAAIKNIANWMGNDDPGPAETAANALSALGSLPVELLYFKGRSNKTSNQLNWATDLQSDFSYFDIQRSSNGLDFYSIKLINGQDISSETLRYEYLDENVELKDRYYRLKMVDLDGTYEYSGVIFINSDNSGYNITVSPNPANNFLNIVIDGPLNEELTLDLIRADGMIVETITLQELDNLKKLDISNFPSGVYILKSRNSANVSQKIIKTQ
jgi:hypothetical protein